jgi:hypothetical protein
VLTAEAEAAAVAGLMQAACQHVLLTCAVCCALCVSVMCAGIVLTNDGHAILREIDVNHPAAKV